MKFDNVHLKLNDMTSSRDVSLEDALCLMSMVSQDINTGMKMPIDNLEVSDWNRFRLYLLRLSNTVSRLYTKHRQSLLAKTPHRHDDRLWSNLDDASSRLAELVEEESALEDKKAALTSELEKVRLKEALIIELNSQITALEQRKKQLRSTDLTALENKQNELEDELHQLKDQIADRKKQTSRLTAQLDEARAQLDDEQKDSSVLEQDLLKKQHELGAVQQKNSALRQILADNHSAYDALTAQLQDLNEDISSVTDQIGQIKQQIQQAGISRSTLGHDLLDVQSQAEACNQELEADQKALEEAYAAYAVVRDQLDTARQALDQVRHDRDDADDALNNIRQEYADQAASLDGLTHEIDGMNQKLTELKDTIAQREFTLADKKTAHSALTGKLGDLDDGIMTLTEALNRLHEQYEKMGQKKEVLLTSRRDLEQTIGQLTREEASLTDAIAKMRQRAAELDASITVLKRKLEEDTAECERLSLLEGSIESDIQTASGRLDGFREKNRSLVEACEILRQKCSDEEALLCGLQDQRGQLDAELETLNLQASATAEEIRQTKERKAACLAKIETLQQSYSQEKSEFDEANTDCRQLQDRLGHLRSEKERLDADTEILRAELEKLADVERQCRETGDALENAYEQTKKANLILESYERGLSDEKQIIQTVTDAAEQLRTSLDEQKQLRNQRQTEYDTLEEESIALRDAVQTLDDQCMSLLTRLCELKTEQETRQVRVDALTAALEEAQSCNSAMISSVVDLESRLTSQEEDNELYRTTVLTPAQAALDNAREDKAAMEQTVLQQNEELENCKEERRKLGETINQTKTLIGLKQKENADRQKELDTEQNRLKDLIREAEAERDRQQRILDDLNTRLNDLTENKIQPLLDAIKRAEEMLQELDPEATLQKYQAQKAELENKVAATRETVSLLEQLEIDLEEQEKNLAQIRHEYEARLDTQRSIQTDHDKYAQDLQFLSSDSKKREVEDCQSRLDTMKQIRRNMMDVSREIGMGMDYSDALDSSIVHAEEILTKIRSNIADFTSLWEDKIDQ